MQTHPISKVFVILSALIAINLQPASAADELDEILEGLIHHPPVKRAEPVATPEEEIPDIEIEIPEAIAPTFTPDEDIIPLEQAATSEVVEKTEDGIEETTLFQIQAVEVKKQGDEEFQVMRIPIPVYYRTRSIAWDQEAIRKALSLQQRILEYSEKLEVIKREGELLVEEYETLILSGIPQEALQSDSPSLPTSIKRDSRNPQLRPSDIEISIEDN